MCLIKRSDIIKKITIEDEIYPEKLKNIPKPPKQLYLEGNINLLKENSIAIVGSRACSENGKSMASKFAEELTKQKLVIVSGMAEGIDTVAHTACLKAKGKTIAVLGNGFNHIFPESNIGLYNEIISRGGLIVSEYPPNVEATSKKFLERNRIVSGLSIGVLVIEAAYRSGTSVTAKIANIQERKVFVIPHEIGDKHGVGTNNLIKKGAVLVTSTKEIIDKFDFLNYDKTQEKSEVKNVKEHINKPNQKEPQFKNNEYKKIYKLIREGVNQIEAISLKCNTTINDVANIIFMLEMEGYIEWKAGVYKCI